MQAFSLFVGLRYTLTRRRNRSVSFISAIAMVGIILGVALLITVLSVMNGFDRELKERILTIMPQVTLYKSGGLDDWRSLREQVISSDDIVAATPFVELQVMLHQGKKTQPALIYGVDAEYESTVSNIGRYLKADTIRSLNQQPLNQQQGVIALGSGVAKKLGLELDDRVTIIVPRTASSTAASSSAPAIRRLKIIDIFKTGTELDHSLALMGLENAAAINDSQITTGITGLHLKIDNLFAASRVAASLRSQLPLSFYTTDWTRTHGNIYYAIKMSKSLVSLLLLLIIAIAAFNVVSTLVMVVVDKQGDIAILRTLGVSNQQIMAIFMVQGSIIGIVGTIVGVVLGVILSLTVAKLVAGLEQLFNVTFLESDIYPVSFLPSSLHLSDVILVASVSLVMSLLATIYPARKASRVQPAQALRYD
ncbi:MAG: lipoprotein-releasing ABC transporter permease subunit [Cellvibrionaceae bacterium]